MESSFFFVLGEWMTGIAPRYQDDPAKYTVQLSFRRHRLRGAGGSSAISGPVQPGQWHLLVFIRGNSGNK